MGVGHVDAYHVVHVPDAGSHVICGFVYTKYMGNTVVFNAIPDLPVPTIVCDYNPDNKNLHGKKIPYQSRNALIWDFFMFYATNDR